VDLLQNLLTVGRSAGSGTIRLVASNQTGMLKGTTKAGDTLEPAWVYLINSAPSLSPILVRRSNSDGTLNVRDLPPGSYRVLALPFHQSLDFSDPAVLARFSSYIASTNVSAGDTSTLDLSVVPGKELQR
jgi:hypothetical protein